MFGISFVPNVSMSWLWILTVLIGTCVAVYLPDIPTNVDGNEAALSIASDQVARKFEKEYVAYLKNGTETLMLKEISTALAKTHSKKDLFGKPLYELSAADQFFACATCRASANVLIRMFREEDGELNGPNSEADIRRVAIDICIRLQIQTEVVCAGLFDSNWPSVEYIVKNSVIDSRTFCSLFLNIQFCSVKNPEFNWILAIDQGAPSVNGPKAEPPERTNDDLNILQLTDIHYDPLYQPGSLAECEEPQCCQAGKEQAEGTSKAAGYWGDYRDCDTPWHLIEHTLEHIKKSHPKIDYIYQTGDIVDHMLWGTSIKKNSEVIRKVNKKLAKAFPNVTIFPCIGNHESHPVNLFSPPDAPENINTKWLYELLYEDWSVWLPSSTKESILQGGYYTVSPRPGFRVIALNNMDCYTDNWWLFNNGTDKKPQLQWLHDTLLQAEKSNEYVHILAHMPSGDRTCWSVWSREYNRIIERFNRIVSAIFNGHTHLDEMNVHYTQAGHAVAVSWNGGSLTPFVELNPNYRIYQVETNTMQVVDHETWIFNLTEANLKGSTESPGWFKEYSFVKEFTHDLSPAGLDNLLVEMSNKPNLLRKFWRYKMTSADPRLAKGCDSKCLLSTICRLATTNYSQKTRCEQLKAQLIIALNNEPTTTTQSPIGTTEKNPGGGANSIISISLSSLFLLFLFISYLL